MTGMVAAVQYQGVGPERDDSDRRADLQAVYREHHDFVWRTLLHLGVHSEAVDDGVQMVFIVVHRRLQTFDGRASMKNWLYGITRRVASDLRRRARRHTENLHLVADPDASGADLRFDERLSTSELVEHFLDALDEDKREVFVLAELEELTAPEIAEATGVNVNTVYARLRAARQLFQRAIDRHHARQARELRCVR